MAKGFSQSRIDAQGHISALTGEANINWDFELSSAIKEATHRPSYNNLINAYSILMGKYMNYYSMILRINPESTKDIKKDLDLVYKWITNADKYSPEIAFKFIVPKLWNINMDIENLLQEARYKYRIGKRRSSSFEDNMLRLKEQIQGNNGEGEEDGEE